MGLSVILGARSRECNSKINKRATCLTGVGACKGHIRRKHHSSEELALCTASDFLGTSIKVAYNEPWNSCCHNALQGLLSPLLIWTLANFKVGIQIQDDQLQSPSCKSDHRSSKPDYPSWLVMPCGNNLRLKEQAFSSRIMVPAGHSFIRVLVQTRGDLPSQSSNLGHCWSVEGFPA